VCRFFDCSWPLLDAPDVLDFTKPKQFRDWALAPNLLPRKIHGVSRAGKTIEEKTMSRPNVGRRQTGFTLVEIAIVLVIIGLLLGGILKGQEMITQARIKNIVNDFNGVTAAYFSYQDRYKAIPGDDQQAQTRWPVANYPGMPNGNGDGTVAGPYNNPPTAALESNFFWFHLRAAGFVPGPTANQPANTQPSNAVGGMVGVQSNPLTITGLAICSANVPDKIAGAVDTQIDDQSAATGSLRSLLQPAGQSNANAPTGTAPAANYVETGNNQYVLCKTI
jgi:prepilin-type N-terminal cleavage/methylation domain-containing protein